MVGKDGITPFDSTKYCGSERSKFTEPSTFTKRVMAERPLKLSVIMGTNLLPRAADA